MAVGQIDLSPIGFPELECRLTSFPLGGESNQFWDLPNVRKGSVGVILTQNTWMAAFGQKRPLTCKRLILVGSLMPQFVLNHRQHVLGLLQGLFLPDD